MPLLYKLTPAVKEAIWGGRRLFDLGKGKNSGLENIAESWELSFVEGSESLTEDGTPVTKAFRDEELYDATLGFDAFPVLTKFIDAKDNLSVQVHPSDEYAKAHGADFGKTEMWYVVRADEGAGLYLGFNGSTDKNEVKRRAEDGTLDKLLGFKPVKSGDVYFIPSGTVHAIGGGVTLFEIQQSSTLTYRIFDYNRLDKDGNPRELHLDSALDVLIPEPYSLTPTEDGKEGCRIIGKCKYFTAREYKLCGKTQDTKAVSSKIPLSKISFLSLTATEGSLTLTLDGNDYTLKAGDTYLAKRGTGEITARGNGTLITVCLE